VVASFVDEPARIAGVQFGIEHDLAPGEFVSCAGGFEIPTDDWPASGSAAAIVWDECNESPGENVRVGFFPVSEAGSGTFSVIPDPRTGFASVADCDAVDRELCDGNLGTLDLAVGTTPTCDPRPGTLPPPPTDVAATTGSCPVTVTWSHEGSGVTGFEVRRDGIPIGSTSAVGRLLVDDDPLVPGETYVYTVLARNACGGVEAETSAESVIPVVTPVTGCETSTDCEDLIVTWDDPQGSETGFRIYRDGEVLATVGPDQTRFVDGTGTYHVPYTYAIQSFDTCGEAPISPGTVGIRRRVPLPVTDLTATDDRCPEVVLGWTDRSTGELAYEVWRDGALIATLPPDATAYVDPDVEAGVPATYVIIGTNACGSRESLPVVGSRTGAPPIAATELSATTGFCERVRLDWIDGSPDEDGFRILRDGVPIAVVEPDVAHFEDDDVPVGVPLSYEVVAFNACGDAAASGAAVGMATDAPPPAATDVEADDGGCFAVTITWTDPAPDVTGFRVLRDGDELALVPGHETTYVDDGAEPGRRYDYAIVTVNECGEAPPSASDVGYAGTDEVLPGPEILDPPPGCEETPVTVRWRSVPLAEEYRLLTALGCDGPPFEVLFTTDTTLVVTELPPGEVTFQVATRNACGEWGSRSACRTIDVADPLPAPEFVDGMETDPLHWQFRWSAVPAADLYVLRINAEGRCWRDSGYEPPTFATFEVTGTDTLVDLSGLDDGSGELDLVAWVFGVHCEGTAGDSTYCWDTGDPVPVLLDDAYAAPVPDGIEVGWRVLDATSVVSFEIHRQLTGRGSFHAIREGIAADQEVYRIVDPTVVDGLGYTYRVMGRNGDGSLARWIEVSATAGVTPARTRIAAVSPNPFNPRTRITLELSRAGSTTLEVYDGSGRRVRRLAEGPLAAGRHRVVWDGRDDDGRGVASGTYYARLRTDHGASVMRMVLVR